MLSRLDEHDMRNGALDVIGAYLLARPHAAPRILPVLAECLEDVCGRSREYNAGHTYPSGKGEDVFPDALLPRGRGCPPEWATYLDSYCG